MYLFNDKKVTGSTFLRDAQKSACKPLKNKVKKNMLSETLPRLEGIKTCKIEVNFDLKFLRNIAPIRGD